MKTILYGLIGILIGSIIGITLNNHYKTPENTTQPAQTISTPTTTTPPKETTQEIEKPITATIPPTTEELPAAIDLPITTTRTQTPDICALAQIRLKETQTEWNHDKFYTHVKELRSQDFKGTYRENLARYFNTEQEVYESWQKSPTHNTNLLATSTQSCLLTENTYWILIKWNPPQQ